MTKDEIPIPRKWSDMVAAASIAGFCVSGVIWIYSIKEDVRAQTARLDAHEKSEQIVFGYINERFDNQKKDYDEVIKRIDNLNTKLDEILKMMVKNHN